MSSETLPETQLPEPDKIEQKLAAKPIGTGGQIRAFVPTTLDETWRLAQILARSNMAPKAYKSTEMIMVGIMAGLELGLTPMTALQTIAVIGNNPAVWGDGALALVQSSGLLEDIDEVFDDSTKTAICTVKRVGRPKAAVRTFSFEDAKQAGLLTKDGPWKQYPKRMAQMRARSWALRDTFADVLKGIGIAEEVRDRVPMGEITAYTERQPLTAALLNSQAGGGEVVEGEVIEQPPVIPEWHEHDTRLRDLIFLATDRAALEEAEREFLAVKSLFPEAEQKRTQADIDAAFKTLAEKED